jgi:hypothetical protein
MSGTHPDPTATPSMYHVRDLLVHMDHSLLPLGLARASDASQWAGQVSGRTVEVLVSLDRMTQYVTADLHTRQTLGARVRVTVSCTARARLYFVPSGFAEAWLTQFLYRLRRLSVRAGPVPWLRTVTDRPALADRVITDTDAVALVRALVGNTPDASAQSASTYVDGGRLWNTSARLYAGTAAANDAAHQLQCAMQLAARVEALAGT